MANLAIKGHATRGKEVIEILEMLGGKNYYQFSGGFSSNIYFINKSGFIFNDYDIMNNLNYFPISLEEFLEQNPYKVGDFVHIPEYDSNVCICKMRWNSLYNDMEYLVNRDGMPEWYTARALLDYNDDFLVDKETNMNEDNNQKTLETKTTEGVIVCNEFCDCYNPKDDVYRNNTTEKIPLEQSKQCKDIDDVRHVNSITDDIMINQITSKVSVIKFNPDVCDNEIELQLGNYKIEVRDGKTYAVKNKPKYPKTYKECCDILGYNASYDLNNITTHDCVYDYKLQMFYRVLICCDAYCKIAGEQMGLEKPWEPDWENYEEYKYCLYITENAVNKGIFYNDNHILAFPTEEMRDAFYENFKGLIESCKELL